MNITITGNLGSGKSSVCRILAEKGYEIISAGAIFRQIAEERGMTVTELVELTKTDHSVDDMLDERSVRLGKEKDNAVFDSRMAWHFIPDSFKVFLLVDTDESARRVYLDGCRKSEGYASLSETKEGLITRASLERENFDMLYGVDYLNTDNYNLVIETTHAKPEQVAGEILRQFDLYKKEPFSGKILMNPASLSLESGDLFCDFPSRNFSEEKPSGEYMVQWGETVQEKDVTVIQGAMGGSRPKLGETLLNQFYCEKSEPELPDL